MLDLIAEMNKCEMKYLRTDEHGDFPGDVPVKIFDVYDDRFGDLGHYEQIGGHTFGSYWGELEYFSDSHGGETMEEDIKIASKECDEHLLAEYGDWQEGHGQEGVATDDCPYGGGNFVCFDNDDGTYTGIMLGSLSTVEFTSDIEDVY